MSKLFSPLHIGNVTLPNRVTVAPMCQYSAIDGSMTDWHLMHLGNLALSGASMLVIEATGVLPEGRITPGCTGLYSDANEVAMERVVKTVRDVSPIVLGIQLGHAGRKASAQLPWLGGKALREIFLCQTVPDPPGNVDFKLVQETTNPQFKTVRQRLGAHATEAVCKGCHKITDPIGLGLENFDTIGGFRASENGAPIDTSGVLDGVNYIGAQGLGKALHDNPNIPSCLVKKMFEYSVGRPSNAAERPWLKDNLARQFANDGYRPIALMRDIVLSEQFSTVIPLLPLQANADGASLTSR